jgi:hypothetical protein
VPCRNRLVTTHAPCHRPEVRTGAFGAENAPGVGRREPPRHGIWEKSRNIGTACSAFGSRTPGSRTSASVSSLDRPGIEVDALGELGHVFIRNRHGIPHEHPLDTFRARRGGERSDVAVMCSALGQEGRGIER